MVPHAPTDSAARLKFVFTGTGAMSELARRQEIPRNKFALFS